MNTQHSSRYAVHALAQHLRGWGANVMVDDRNFKVTAVYGAVKQTAVLREGDRFDGPEGMWWYLVYPAPSRMENPRTDYDRHVHRGRESEMARRIINILRIDLPKKGVG